MKTGMTVVALINSSQLEAICKVLADTEKGLTGAEIGRLLKQLDIDDPSPSMTKWRRLHDALMAKQESDGHGGGICRFVEAAMDPVRFVEQREKFEERRDALNPVIAFLGYSLGDDGKLQETEPAKTLDDAERRASRLQAELRRRGVHPDVLQVCQARFLRQDGGRPHKEGWQMQDLGKIPVSFRPQVIPEGIGKGEKALGCSINPADAVQIYGA